MDMTFGFGRRDRTVLGPDFQAGNFGLDTLGDSRHERRKQPSTSGTDTRAIPSSFTTFNAR